MTGALLDLRWEWQRWKGHGAALLILLVGFALLASLLGLGLRLGERLFLSNPVWADADASFLTIGRRGLDGQFKPINRLSIDAAAQFSGVEAVSWLSLRPLDLAVGERMLSGVQAAFLAPDFPEVVGLRLDGWEAFHQQGGVWVSARFLEAHFPSLDAAMGQTLHHPRLPSPLRIVGLLPAGLATIGTHSPDLWLDASLQTHLTPFSGESAAARARVDVFLRDAPMYHGVARASVGVRGEGLLASLDALAPPPSAVSFGEDGASIWVVEGLEFNPLGREELRQRWIMIMALIAGFGLVLALNALGLYAARAVAFSESLQIVRVLGGTPGAVQRSALLGAAGLLLPILVLALLLQAGFTQVVQSDVAYRAQFGDQPLGMGLRGILAAMLAVSSLLMFCALLPLLGWTRRMLFSRAMNSSPSPLQQLGLRANLSAQWVLAIIALSVTLELTLQEVAALRSVSVSDSVRVASLRFSGSSQLPAELRAGRLAEAPGLAFAVSLHAADGVGDWKQVQHPWLRAESELMNFQVSGNWSSLLGVPTLERFEGWPDGAILNRSAAELLLRAAETESDIRALAGTRLDLLDTAQPLSLPIVGIIADVPHRGPGNPVLPAAYTPINELHARVARQWHLYFDQMHESELLPALEAASARLLTGPELSVQGSMVEIMSAVNQTRQQMIRLALLLCLLLLIFAALSLGFQVSGRLALSKQDRAVHLAVGAPRARVLLATLKEPLAMLLPAVPAAAMVLWLLRSDMIPSTLAAPGAMALLLAVLVALSLVVVACLLPAWRLLRRPIAELLR